MKRRMLVVLTVLCLCITSLFVMAACNDKTETDLNDVKASSIATLEAYATAKGQSNYSADNWTSIQQKVTDGKAAINAATKEADVKTALENAKTAIDGVQTLAQQAKAALTESKAAAVSEVNDNYNGSGFDYLTADEITALTAAKTTGLSAIGNASTVESVNLAKTAAINAMTEIRPEVVKVANLEEYGKLMESKYTSEKNRAVYLELNGIDFVNFLTTTENVVISQNDRVVVILSGEVVSETMLTLPTCNLFIIGGKTTAPVVKTVLTLPDDTKCNGTNYEYTIKGVDFSREVTDFTGTLWLSDVESSNPNAQIGTGHTVNLLKCNFSASGSVSAETIGLEFGVNAKTNSTIVTIDSCKFNTNLTATGKHIKIIDGNHGSASARTGLLTISNNTFDGNYDYAIFRTTNAVITGNTFNVKEPGASDRALHLYNADDRSRPTLVIENNVFNEINDAIAIYNHDYTIYERFSFKGNTFNKCASAISYKSGSGFKEMDLSTSTLIGGEDFNKTTIQAGTYKYEFVDGEYIISQKSGSDYVRVNADVRYVEKVVNDQCILSFDYFKDSEGVLWVYGSRHTLTKADSGYRPYYNDNDNKGDYYYDAKGNIENNSAIKYYMDGTAAVPESKDGKIYVKNSSEVRYVMVDFLKFSYVDKNNLEFSDSVYGWIYNIGGKNYTVIKSTDEAHSSKFNYSGDVLDFVFSQIKDGDLLAVHREGGSLAGKIYVIKPNGTVELFTAGGKFDYVSVQAVIDNGRTYNKCRLWANKGGVDYILFNTSIIENQGITGLLNAETPLTGVWYGLATDKEDNNKPYTLFDLNEETAFVIKDFQGGHLRLVYCDVDDTTYYYLGYREYINHGDWFAIDRIENGKIITKCIRIYQAEINPSTKTLGAYYECENGAIINVIIGGSE